MSTEAPRIVVGIDTTPGSELALRWALFEARLHHLPLHVVCAFTWAVSMGHAPVSASETDVGIAGLRNVADNAVNEALRRAADSDPDVAVTGEAIEGDPVTVLIEASRSATLMVLGSRQLHAAGSFLLGSVGSQVTARSACPTVITRGPSVDPAAGASVVVGVDATPDSDAVLQFAFDEASRRGSTLHAVLCWHPRVLSREWFTPNWIVRSREQADLWLSESLAGWREKYPDVAVSSGVVDEHPVKGLVDASMGSVMLVVGSRARTRVSDVLPGHTAQEVLHHAVSPVAVVPLPADESSRPDVS